MNILIIDNYDSFTYNLYQMIGEILTHEKKCGSIQNFNINVKRNDEVSLDSIKKFAPDRIIISPGPGTPEDEDYFGICAEVILKLGKTIPLLGVCLGMQGIAHVFGGKVIKATLPMHGKTSPITHQALALFKDIPNPLEIMRYHSLIVENGSLPNCLAITAIVGQHETDILSHRDALLSKEIMAIQHTKFPIYGIQFHPESFATEGGKDILSNFIFIK